MQEFLEERAISIDRLMEEKAPLCSKTYYLVTMLHLDGSEKSLQNRAGCMKQARRKRGAGGALAPPIILNPN